MGLRETINQKKSVSVGGAILLFVVAGSFLAYTQWPARVPKGDKAFYTVDDGQTWFRDSVRRVPPFEVDGKTAVRALVFSYANGSKTFCPVLEQYDSDMKKMLDDAVADANREGKPLSSIALFNSPGTGNRMQVKLSGSGHKWVSKSNLPEAAKMFGAVQAPDGSAVDSVIP
jgi:hypothetical protein